MKISVLGLGYVGAVSAACLAQEGHEVIGVDPVERKVDLINAGKTPIIERDIGEMIEEQVAARRLSASSDVISAVRQSDLVFVCVGTPSRNNGDIDLTYIKRVCEQIGAALREHDAAPAIVIRSTMLPGTMRNVVIPTLEAHSQRRAGVDFGVCINPEFLRESTAVYDYFHPPKTVIGEFNRPSGNLLASLYEHMSAPLVRTDIESAEGAKAQAVSAIAEYEATLASARVEASRIIDDARAQAESGRKEKIAAAEAEVAELRAAAAAEVSAAKSEALQSMRSNVAAIAVQAAEAVVQKPLDAGASRAIVDEYLNRAVSQN
jgi:F0F1-type ATP synthase membrane subunit b/b'